MNAPITYRKSCLDPQATCSLPETRAAFMDYVSTVYTDTPAAQYDGQLTREESKAFLRQYGSAQRLQRSDFNGFLHRVHLQFATEHNIQDPGNSNCGPPSLAITTHSRKGTAIIKGELHTCGMKNWEALDTHGIEFYISAEPENWQLALESAWNVGTKREDGSYRANYLWKNMAAKLHLPLLEALPDRLQTFQAASKSHPAFSPEDYAAAIALETYFEFKDAASLATLIGALAPATGLNQETIASRCQIIIDKFGNDTTGLRTWVNARWREYHGTVNSMIPAHLDDLRKNPTFRKKTFYQVGANHSKPIEQYYTSSW